jgi:hypothetical protein
VWMRTFADSITRTRASILQNIPIRTVGSPSKHVRNECLSERHRNDSGVASVSS